MPFSLSSSALNDYQRFLSLLVGNDAYVDTPPLTVNYLVIAGGGGGGSNRGGGGGAGGYREVTGETLATSTNYTVTVGAGGAGLQAPIASASGLVGNNSVFGTITSAGGGGGGGGTSTSAKNGGNGGSGGGGGQGTTSPAKVGGTGDTPSTSPAQGTNGGAGGVNASNIGSAGGGGGAASAGAAGSNANNGVGGAGGSGTASSITGSSVTRAGGGGGGAFVSTGGAGGTGGGGAGSGNDTTANSGTANTGGGGGGGGGQTTGAYGGNGGSGAVILKYPITYDMTVSAGLGYKTVMSGEYKITEFTAGTGTVSFALAPTVTGFSEDILQEIVLEDSAASVTFANLDQYASTYQHLQLRVVGLFDIINSSIVGRFNNDSAGNYAHHRLQGNGSGVYSGAVTSTTNMVFHYNQDNNSTNEPGVAVIDILDPFETSKYTTTRSLSGTASGASKNQINLWSSLWQSTDAITDISISVASGYTGWESGNYRIGSRFTLIGVK